MVKAIGKSKGHHDFLALPYRFIDAVTIFFSLEFSLFLYGTESNQDYLVINLIAVISYFLAAESFSLYRSWRTGYFKQLIFYTFNAWVLSIASVLLFLFFSKSSIEFSRITIAIWFIVTYGILIIWRLILKSFLAHIRSQGHNTRPVGIIGLNPTGRSLAREISNHTETGYILKGIYDPSGVTTEHGCLPDDFDSCKGDIDSVVELAKSGELEVVFIALPMVEEEAIKGILFKLSDTNAAVHIVPDMFVHSLLNTPISHVGYTQTVNVYYNPMKGHHAVLKRLEDIILSTCILVVIAIPLLVIAIKLKRTSSDPVLFKQNRYGINGQKISVWKFRSMTVSECKGDVVQATKNDARVTPFGAFLRRTSLDELPQFFNVLKGDMSVVGPRPHAVAHNEEYRTQVDYYMLRHKVKPGITGWAQINGWRGETDSLDKMEMRVSHDLEYIRNWSLLMDFKIVFLTVFRAFNDKSVY